MNAGSCAFHFKELFHAQAVFRKNRRKSPKIEIAHKGNKKTLFV